MVQRDGSCQSAEGSSEPETAVDDQVDAAAILCRNEFVDRRVNRCIFSTDAQTRQQTEYAEASEIPGDGAQQHARQIDDEGNVKHEAPPEAVGNPAEKNRAGHRSCDVE